MTVGASTRGACDGATYTVSTSVFKIPAGLSGNGTPACFVVFEFPLLPTSFKECGLSDTSAGEAFLVEYE